MTYSVRVPFNDLSRASEDARRQDYDAVAGVLRRGVYLAGPEVGAFEEEFAETCGAAHAIAVANGTDALELSLRAVGVVDDDDVVVVANAGGYASTACRLIGARPVYVDIDPGTLLASPLAIFNALTPRTRAVVCTHLFGSTVDVPTLRRALADAEIAIVEDCAQAHLARIGCARVGTLGDIGAFSFYPTKNLAAVGDAGAIVTCRSDLAETVRVLRQYGWTERSYAAARFGRNSRMDEIQAAVLRGRLPRLNQDNEKRVSIIDTYTSRLAALLEFPVRTEGHVGHLCVALTDRRDELRRWLDQSGIGTAVHYPFPDYMQPAFAEFRNGHLSVTEESCARILSLPCFPSLTDGEIDHVCKTIEQWHRWTR